MEQDNTYIPMPNILYNNLASGCDINDKSIHEMCYFKDGFHTLV